MKSLPQVRVADKLEALRGGPLGVIY